MDYPSIGKQYNTKPGHRAAIAAAVNALVWEPICDSKQIPLAPGMAIQAAIKEFGIPRVSQIAYNATIFNRYGFYGIEGNYRNGRVRLYLMDRGSDLIPIAAQNHGIPETQDPAAAACEPRPFVIEPASLQYN